MSTTGMNPSRIEPDANDTAAATTADKRVGPWTIALLSLLVAGVVWLLLALLGSGLAEAARTNSAPYGTYGEPMPTFWADEWRILTPFLGMAAGLGVMALMLRQRRRAGRAVR